MSGIYKRLFNRTARWFIFSQEREKSHEKDNHSGVLSPMLIILLGTMNFRFEQLEKEDRINRYIVENIVKQKLKARCGPLWKSR